MNISEVKTSYPNYQKPLQSSFKANNTIDQRGSGSSILLGTISAASALTAGVALYKNHKTGKALKETLNKLNQAENELKINKDKVDETVKKLEEISSKQISKADEEITEKESSSIKEWFKRQGEKGGKCLYNFGRFMDKKFNSIKSRMRSDSKFKKTKKDKPGKIEIGINEAWLHEQMEIRQKSGEELSKTINDLNQLKALHKQYKAAVKKLEKMHNRTEKIKSKNNKAKSDAEAKIEELKFRIEELTNELKSLLDPKN